MALQTSAQSTVGGGLLTASVVRALVDAGHTVDVVGPVVKGADVRVLGAAHHQKLEIGNYDAAVILTGPYNPLYGNSAFDTYRRLASFSGAVIYTQWDVALPFHFNAMTAPKVAEIAKVQHTDVMRDKKWFIMAQTSEAELRAKSSKTVGYNTTPFVHVPCLFELEEIKRKPLVVCEHAVPHLGYLGSDRPGRIAEVLRWFANEASPSVHLFGRWSTASLKRLGEAQGLVNTLEYRGMVSEEAVTSTLNKYAATMYLADPAYVKTDFIAQRFFENVTAGVPTLYSDKLQPSVAAAISKERICHSAEELAMRVEEVIALPFSARRRLVLEHSEEVCAFADSREDTITNAFARALP